MDTNPTVEVDKIVETVNNGITVESIHDDMATYGVDVQESKEEVETVSTTAETKPKEEEQEKPKKKSRGQRKIERQARELKAKDEEIAELRQIKREKRMEEFAEERAKEPDAILTAVEDIDIDDFEDYESYREAVDKAEAVANTKAEEATIPTPEEKPDGLSKELTSRIQIMGEEGAEDYDDFDEVVRNPDVPLTADVLEAVTESDVAADIAYYLATHIDNAKKLAEMTPRQMTKEILRIEIDLEKKPNKAAVRSSNAPEPINPVSGGNSSKSKSLNDDDLSFEEHEALLNKRKLQQTGGFI